MVIGKHVGEGGNQRLLLLLSVSIGEIQNFISGPVDQYCRADADCKHQNQAAQQ